MVDTSLMEVASAEFLERHSIVPFSKDETGRVTVVVNDLDNKAVKKAVADLFQDRATLALGPSDVIEQTLDDYARYREKTEAGQQAYTPAESVIEQVDHLIQSAIIERASDIHLEPMPDRIRLRYRIDGVLVFKTDLPKDLLPMLVSRIKVMAEMDIADHNRHQGGRILFTFKGVEYDLRVSDYVTVNGENVVIRILNKQIGLVSLQELGMSPGLHKRFRREVLDVPSGVVLITAPTGEGKTTTLYSCLDYSNDESVKIITAEDPVEYSLEGVIQCAILDKAGRGFDSTLREIVRQDPDIVVLGEIRDVPTSQFAIEAALTGHKVYCTFHTEDSVAALLRLIEMGIEPFLISSTVRSVLAQRLLRRICTACITDDTPTLQDFEALGIDPSEAQEFTFKRGQGCALCNFTGYRGRVAVFECLILTEKLRDAVYHRKPADTLHRLAYESAGFVSLREDAIAKAVKGVTSLAEVKRKTPIPQSMRPIGQIVRTAG
jgi:type IV pilus assembly protein PilB